MSVLYSTDSRGEGELNLEGINDEEIDKVCTHMCRAKCICNSVWCIGN